MPEHLNIPPPVLAERSSVRRAGAVDAEIGQKIKVARSMRGITQETLADRLGLSCQQLQKYESGSSRIAVSRLVEVARELRVQVTELLTPSTLAEGTCSTDRANGYPQQAATRVASAQDLKNLVNAFCEIRNEEARKKILEMAQFFATLDTVERTAVE